MVTKLQIQYYQDHILTDLMNNTSSQFSASQLTLNKTQSQKYEESNTYNQANSRILKTPSIIRIASNDDYSKNKIMELQEEVLKLRRELSQRDNNYKREKNTLLNKVEIIAMQNTEMKQRQNHLMQINQTLELALASKQNNQERYSKKEEAYIQQIKNQLAEKNKILKGFKRQIQELKKRLRVCEDQKQAIRDEKDKTIEDLNQKNKQLMLENQNQIKRIQNSLNNLPFNRDVMQSIFNALNSHVNSDYFSDSMNFQSNNIQQSPITKRIAPDRRGYTPTKGKDTSYSRISSHSIISQLNSKPTISQCSDDEYQPEHILCQICKKVFEEQQFICHMEQCSQIYQLQRKRQQLERAINDLDTQQRTSVSQRKCLINPKKQRNQDESLREWDQNTPSKSRLNKKQSCFGRQAGETNKINNYSNKPLLTSNNYRSNKLY